jgi:hypothetical protein
VAYFLIVENAEPKDRQRIDNILNAPLETRSTSSEAVRRGAAMAAVGRAVVVR